MNSALQWISSPHIPAQSLLIHNDTHLFAITPLPLNNPDCLCCFVKSHSSIVSVVSPSFSNVPASISVLTTACFTFLYLVLPCLCHLHVLYFWVLRHCLATVCFSGFNKSSISPGIFLPCNTELVQLSYFLWQTKYHVLKWKTWSILDTLGSLF